MTRKAFTARISSETVLGIIPYRNEMYETHAIIRHLVTIVGGFLCSKRCLRQPR